MTKEQYIILTMVLAGIATNFLGAAFTIMRLRARRKEYSSDSSVKTPHGITLPEFGWSFVEIEIRTIYRGVRFVIHAAQSVSRRLGRFKDLG
jgi:hypothetical protein